jgi:hypothetical protein
MEDIVVLDNFLNEQELKKAYTIIISSSTWKFGHKSNSEANETPFWTMDLNDEPFFSIYLKEIIEKTFLKKYVLKRVYANGQTYGQDGSYHIDSEKENTYTFCLYLNNIKPKDVDAAGGCLYIKIPDKKYKICYQPINNRGIMFPSNYYHKGVSFTRYIMDMRICVAWKFEEESVL